MKTTKEKINLAEFELISRKCEQSHTLKASVDSFGDD